MTTTTQTPQDDKFINLNQLREKLAGRSRSSIYLDIEHNRLPRPMKLGGRLYWSDSAINAAMASLQAA